MENKRTFTQKLRKMLAARREKHMQLNDNLEIIYNSNEFKVVEQETKSVYLSAKGNNEREIRKQCVNQLAIYAGEEAFKNGDISEHEFLNRYLLIAKPILKAYNSPEIQQSFVS